MIKAILLLAQIFTFQLDVVRSDHIEVLDCHVIPVDGTLVQYDLTNNRLYSMIDCTHIFSDGFEP